VKGKWHFERMRRTRSEPPCADSASHGTIKTAVANRLQNFDIFDLAGLEIDNDFELAGAANSPPWAVGRVWRNGTVDCIRSNLRQA
jgi:hypothetical protein